MRIIELEINRKRLELVSGLVWHPLQASGSARAKDLLSFAKAGECDLKVLRGDEAPHVGLARRKKGAKVGHISAAAMVADALAAENKRNFLAAIPLPDDPNSVLFVAVRDSIILADGDYVDAAQAVRQRIAEDTAYGGWDIVVCPDEWHVPGSTSRAFDDFFSPAQLKKAKQWRLKEVQVDIRRTAILVGLCAAVAIGGTYGWKLWKTYQADSAAAVEAQRAQQEQEAAARAQAALANATPPHPWPLLPRAPEFAKACAQAFASVGTIAGNWRLDGAGCENGQLSVRWVKNGDTAWISHLKAVRPNAVIAGDGQSATVTVPIAAAASGETGEQLQHPLGLRLRYFELGSRFGLVAKLEAPQAPAAIQKPPGQATPPPQWNEMPIQVSSPLDPIETALVVDSPGLRFTKLVFSFTKDGLPQYQFTGVQYVRP